MCVVEHTAVTSDESSSGEGEFSSGDEDEHSVDVVSEDWGSSEEEDVTSVNGGTSDAADSSTEDDASNEDGTSSRSSNAATSDECGSGDEAPSQEIGGGVVSEHEVSESSGDSASSRDGDEQEGTGCVEHAESEIEVDPPGDATTRTWEMVDGKIAKIGGWDKFRSVRRIPELTEQEMSELKVSCCL